MKNSFLAKVLLLFALMMSSGHLYAADSSNTSPEEATKALKEIIDRPIHTEGENVDYAQRWFRQIFGGFIFAPWQNNDPNGAYDPDSKTLISEAVGFTNILALGLGMVIVYYVFIGGSINAAGKGEAMGQNWSATWMPLRTMIGFGLIMPIGKLGGGVLSLSQVFIIWLIMLGSNAGSSLWYTLAEKITAGVEITEPNIRLNKSQVAEIAKMMTCADMHITMSNGNDPYAIVKTRNKNIEIKGVLKGDTYRINSGASFTPAPVKEIREIAFGKNGKCGGFEFNLKDGYFDVDETASDYKTIAKNNGYLAAKIELIRIFEKIDDVVINLRSDSYSADNLFQSVKKIDEGQSAPSATENQLYSEVYVNKLFKSFDAEANNYSASFVKNIHKAIVGSSEINEKFMKEMTRGGWGGAGVWFFEIGSISGISYNVSTSFIEDKKAASPDLCPNSLLSFEWIFFWKDNECDTYATEYNASIILINKMLADSVEGDLTPTETDRALSSCTGSESCSVDPAFTERWSTSFAQDILNILSYTDAESAPVGSGSYPIVSPFQTITSIGHSMNTSAAVLYSTAIGITVLIETVSAILPSPSGDSTPDVTKGTPMSLLKGLGSAVKAVWKEWITPVLLGSIMGLVTMGFTLAYVIPFLPIVTWTLMIIGYLVTVIEAVIAAPLAVIMMVTPEGEGISGTRLERAMQLIATAILKPSLMVIGMVASVTMGYVAFQIWNGFFFKTAEHVLSGSIFDIFAVISIYTMTTFTICNLIIGIMHRLPNQILEWFSSGVSRPFGEDSAQQGVEASAGHVKGFADKAAQSLGTSLGEKRREEMRRYRADKEKEKTAN